MRSLICLIILLSSLVANAKSPTRQLHCQDVSYGNLVIANISMGTIILTDISGQKLDRLAGLIVATKQIGRYEVVWFKNNGNYPYLPSIVFEAKIDESGRGIAKSFNDLSGGTTDFRCTE